MAVDMKEFLSRHDLLWTKNTTFLSEAAFLGNGMIGARILGEEHRSKRNVLRFVLGRNDVTCARQSYYDPRVPVGEVELCFDTKIGFETNMRLNLYDAEFVAGIATAAGKVHVRSFTHKLTDVLVIETTVETEEHVEFNWVPEPEVSTAVKHSDGINIDQYIPETKVTRTQRGGINIGVQDYGQNTGCSAAWTEKHVSEDHRIFYISLTNRPDEAAAGQAAELVEQAANTPFEELVQSHRDAWHAYYEKSFLSIPDTQLEGFYWIQIYKLACATRPDGCVIDNQGPWTAPTPWPGTWYNMNVQLAYSPVYTSNHLEIGESLCRNLDRNRDALIHNVPEAYQQDSAGLGRCSSHDMVAPLYDEVGNLTWLCHNYYRQCSYGGDSARMREGLYPLLKRSVNYYLHILEKDENGTLHLPPAVSPEYGSFKGLKVEDATYDLALLRWGLKTLMALSDEFQLEDAQYGQWREILAALADYPVSQTGLMIGKDVEMTHGHRHYSHLFPFYPLHLLDTKDKENWDLAYRSLKHWFSMEGDLRGFTFVGAAALASTLGLGDEALACLKTLVHFATPNTMYQEAGPVLESSIGLAEGLHYMLLQSHNKVIRVFPAVPAQWQEVAFADLRTEGAFLVSAERKAGKTTFIKIKSCCGGVCKLETDLKSVNILSAGGTQRMELDGGAFTCDLEAGGEIILSDAAYDGPYVIEPVAAQKHLCNFFGQKKSWRLYGLPTTL